jgi:hypothetical protein
MLTRVSNIEVYRDWMHWAPLFDGDEEPTIEQIVGRITKDEPSEQMKAGSAFHVGMERAALGGSYDRFEVDGYKFLLPEAELELSPIREMRAFKDYGDLTVAGKVDSIDGRIVMDHKTTGRVDLDRYLDGCQWRFYLDIFGADIFRWHIFEITETDPKVYRVKAPQVLEITRYPELHDDCAGLASDYLAFARQMNLPDARID